MSEHTHVKLADDFRFQWEEAQQCFVLLYPEGMVQLNPSAGEILQRCQSLTSIDSLITDLETKFPDADNIAADIREFLNDAVQQGWLVFSAGPES